MNAKVECGVEDTCSFLGLRRKQIEQHRRLLDAIDRNAGMYRSVLQAIAKLNVDTKFEACTWMPEVGGWLRIECTGDRHKLNAVFGLLRRLGLEPSSRPEPKASSYSTFWKYGAHDCAIYLNFSSTQCRRVKTGTKTVEQDVYEIVCDEQEFPERVTEPSPAEAEELPF